MENKVCSKCGAEMPGDAKFCTKCGQSFEKTAPKNHTSKQKLNKKSLYALLAVLGILFLIIFGAMYYSEYSERREARIAREKFVQDSIKRAEIAAEKAKQEEERIKEEEAKAKSPQAVKERVKYIYDRVFSNLYDDNDSHWLTDEYKTLLKKDQDFTPAGAIGFINSDHWIQGQDYENPSMTIQSVEKASETKAIVKIKVKAFGSGDYVADVKLVLIYERGDWYIDDFISYNGRQEVSEKKELQNYISSFSRKSD